MVLRSVWASVQLRGKGISAPTYTECLERENLQHASSTVTRGVSLCGSDYGHSWPKLRLHRRGLLASRPAGRFERVVEALASVRWARIDGPQTGPSPQEIPNLALPFPPSARRAAQYEICEVHVRTRRTAAPGRE